MGTSAVDRPDESLMKIVEEARELFGKYNAELVEIDKQTSKVLKEFWEENDSKAAAAARAKVFEKMKGGVNQTKVSTA